MDCINLGPCNLFLSLHKQSKTSPIPASWMCVKCSGTITTPKLQRQRTLHQINSWQFKWCNVLHRVASNKFPPIVLMYAMFSVPMVDVLGGALQSAAHSIASMCMQTHAAWYAMARAGTCKCTHMQTHLIALARCLKIKFKPGFWNRFLVFRIFCVFLFGKQLASRKHCVSMLPPQKHGNKPKPASRRFLGRERTSHV